MIAAAAGAELRRGLVAETLRDGADRPVGVHHRMGAAMFEFRADAEARLGFNGADEIRFVAAKVIERQIEDGEFDAAGDVHADGVGDDGVVGGEHAADGQPVADVGIGHERGGDGDGQLAGVLHLLERVGVQVRAPLAIRDGMLGHDEKLRGLNRKATGKLLPALFGRASVHASRLVSSFLFFLNCPRTMNRIVVARASSPAGPPRRPAGCSFRRRDAVGTRSRGRLRYELVRGKPCPTKIFNCSTAQKFIELKMIGRGSEKRQSSVQPMTEAIPEQPPKLPIRLRRRASLSVAFRWSFSLASGWRLAGCFIWMETAIWWWVFHW